jgi:GNAT superfamily N-acetyltransferase
MGERTPDFYEGLISAGRMVVAGRDGVVVGFVDEEPGELTRLFLLAEVSGIGLGRQLLQIGIDLAKAGHDGKIRVESTKNAE